MKAHPVWADDAAAAWRKLDAEKVAEVVTGKTAREVLESARSERSFLHGCFEWNNSKAAEAHRLQQARALMRCVVFVYKPTKAAKPLTMRYLVNVGEEREGEKPYEAVVKVLKNEDLRNEYVRDLTSRLVSVRDTLEAVKSLSRSFVEASEKVGQAILALKGAEA